MDELLRRLSWPVLRRLGLHLGGAERSQVRGPGLEYSDAREYSPGDDTRLIDWNLTARSNRPYVKDSFPERGLDAWLLLDVSPSMSWGTARCLKAQVVVELAVAATELLGRSGNRVGGFLFGGPEAAILPPRAGRNHRLRLLSAVERAGLAAAEDRAATDLTQALERFERAVRRRGLLLLVTDFLTGTEWERPLARMAVRHEVIAVHVADPREGAIPDVGIVTFEDPETGRQMTVDTSSRRLRERFEAAARDQRLEIHRRLRHCRVEVLTLSTEHELLAPLVRFLALRRAMRSMRGPRAGVPGGAV